MVIVDEVNPVTFPLSNVKVTVLPAWLVRATVTSWPRMSHVSQLFPAPLPVFALVSAAGATRLLGTVEDTFAIPGTSPKAAKPPATATPPAAKVTRFFVINVVKFIR
jgi:hypothetical protein